MSTERKPSTVGGRRRPKTDQPQTARPAGDMRAAFQDRSRPQVVNTSFNFPRDFHEHMRRLAFERGVSMKDIIIEAVQAQHPMP
ncbi:hypothetical protein E4A47_10325 [Micrococcus flavus]|uniref:Uncharacterized protein n=1 Tax=Micrococcus flavus TaxID=384602 RepID=A0A4Y8WWM2_9MICC|nr:hypothetical protein [Micrococcus flavus]MBB4883963.1 hypothetical protein [Micrococcus flavus]TFH99373.1 hypothetical protein E4A47_10325 [Micrococcus flavus]GGK54314.1 hypothetical protein GCM10007073_21760 [Micrococcus flavus]